MKKFGIALFCLVLISAASMAQPRDFNPEEFAKRQTAQLKEELGLTTDQEKKVYEINLESIKKMIELREEARSSGGGFDGMREKMSKAREEQNKKMKEVLTDEQWTKYEKYLEERRARMRERRRQ